MDIQKLVRKLSEHNQRVSREQNRPQTSRKSSTPQPKSVGINSRQKEILQFIYHEIEQGKHIVPNRLIAEQPNLNYGFVSANITPLVKKGLLKKSGGTTDRSFDKTERGQEYLHPQPKHAQGTDQTVAENDKVIVPSKLELRVFQTVADNIKVIKSNTEPQNQPKTVASHLTDEAIAGRVRARPDKVEKAIVRLAKMDLFRIIGSGNGRGIALGDDGIALDQKVKADVHAQLEKKAKFSDLSVEQLVVFHAIITHLKHDRERHELDTNMLDKSIKKTCPSVPSIEKVISGLAQKSVIKVKTKQGGRLIILAPKGRKIARMLGMKPQSGTVAKKSSYTGKSEKALQGFEPLDIGAMKYPYAMIFHNVWPIRRGVLYGMQDRIIFAGKTIHKYLDNAHWLQFFTKGDVLAVMKRKSIADEPLARVHAKDKRLMIYSPFMVKYLSRAAQADAGQHPYLQVSGYKQDGVLFFDLSQIEPYYKTNIYH